MRLVNGRRVCDSVRNLWLHPEVFGKPRTRLAKSVANRRVPSRSCGYCRTVSAITVFAEWLILSEQFELGIRQIPPFARPKIARQLKITNFDALQRQNNEMCRTAHLSNLAFAPFAQDELQKPRVVSKVLNDLNRHRADRVAIVQRERR